MKQLFTMLWISLALASSSLTWAACDGNNKCDDPGTSDACQAWDCNDCKNKQTKTDHDCCILHQATLFEHDYDDFSQLPNCGPVVESDSACSTGQRSCDNSTCDQHCPRRIVQAIQYYDDTCGCPSVSCPPDPGYFQDDIPTADCYHTNYQGQAPCRCVGAA